MKTNASKRDAIAQAMDWLGELREDDRAEPTLGGSGEPAAAPAVTAPPVPAPPVPRVSDEDDPRQTDVDDPRQSDVDDPRKSDAITERAPIGDELRIPIAWCDMDACISYYDHPAALGEADIRTRAIAAGWRVDAVGRLACPQCQQSVPWFWTTQPVVVWDRSRAVTAAARMAATVRADATGSAGDTAEPGTIAAVESPSAPWPAEGWDPEGSRGSDQATWGRPDRS
jgi:hypothetical protein